jgi:hypothetical protein
MIRSTQQTAVGQSSADRGTTCVTWWGCWASTRRDNRQRDDVDPKRDGIDAKREREREHRLENDARNRVGILVLDCITDSFRTKSVALLPCPRLTVAVPARAHT